jgi:outer membrane protein assembly factor BamB
MPGAVIAAPAQPNAAPAQPQVVAPTGDWAQFHNGPTRVGYNAQEHTLSGSNLDLVATAWTGTTGGDVWSSPAVANGVVYVGSFDGKLYAYAVGCDWDGGSCDPLWTADAGAATATHIYSSPAVVNGVVYVGSADYKLYAFDANGVTGCTGAPKTCDPLWTSVVTGDTVTGAPAVVNGVVYVGSDDGKLYAFDAAGVTGCSGTPKTCDPLWTSVVAGGGFDTSAPAVSNGVVYVGSDDGKLYAFDAAGVTGCSGSPKICDPLWTAALGSIYSSPAVANGVVYVGSFDDGKLYAFSAAGVTGCSGSPKTCNPLWTGATGGYIDTSSPAVANGVVYVGSNDGKLYAFSAAGVTGCSGSPKTCNPLWTAVTGDSVQSSPAVANGVVYVGSYDNNLYAFDAAGVSHCSGSPKTCSPLRAFATGGSVRSSPAISNGVVYVGSLDDTLYAFDLRVTRYYGTTRFATAAAVSAHTFPANCHCMAYIAYAYNFPDALAGAAAAGTVPGPILLVNTTGAIDSSTATELIRLQPTQIAVLGSEGVVSAQVMTDLGVFAGGGGVVRYSGVGRFATAAAISSQTFAPDCGCVAYIAYAYNFPDALAGAAAAGTVPGPVLLADTTGAIDSHTAFELTRLKPTKIIVLGSKGVISAQVMIDLEPYAGVGGVVRYAGTGRFATAAAISAATFPANCHCIVYIAYAYNFPDALAGAAAAGTIKGPVLLVNTTGPIDPNTSAELIRLMPWKIVVLGSTSVISDGVLNSLGVYLAPTP